MAVGDQRKPVGAILEVAEPPVKWTMLVLGKNCEIVRDQRGRVLLAPVESGYSINNVYIQISITAKRIIVNSFV